MSQPKIMVFHLKELISAMILFAVGILLIVLFIVFLLPKITGYGKDTGTMSDGVEETSHMDIASSGEVSSDSNISSGVSSADGASSEKSGASSADNTSDDPAASANSASEISSGNLADVNSDVAGSSSSDAIYYAGIYTSSYVMNNQTMEIEVVLDENHINSIRFVNVGDAVETVSPLLLPAMESLAEQIVNSQSLDSLTAPEGSEYTYQVLIEAIRTTIAKGEVG